MSARTELRARTAHRREDRRPRVAVVGVSTTTDVQVPKCEKHGHATYAQFYFAASVLGELIASRFPSQRSDSCSAINDGATLWRVCPSSPVAGTRPGNTEPKLTMVSPESEVWKTVTMAQE